MELEFKINGQVIDHPLGWDGLKLTLERHQEYHGVIEYVDTDFIYVGNGAQILIDALNNEGPDAILILEIFLTYNKVKELVYEGQFDLKLIEIINFGNPIKVKCPVVQKTTWTALMNNKSVEYDVSGNEESFELTSQTIPYKYKKKEEILFDNGSFSIGNPVYLMHDFTPEMDEFDTFDYGMNVSAENPVTVKKYFLKAQYGGSYSVRYRVLIKVTINSSTTIRLTWYYAVNNTVTQIGSPVTSSIVDGLSQITLDRDITLNLTLNKNDEIYFFGKLERLSGSTNNFSWNSGSFFPAIPPIIPEPFRIDTKLEINALTEDEESEADLLRLNFAFRSCINMAASSFPVINYPMSAYAIAKGKYLRGFNPNEFPLNISFDKLFQSTRAILPVGIWFNGTDIIIDEAKNFYQDDEAIELVADLSTVTKVDNQKIFKTVVIGYNRWESESPGGVNDVHGKLTYDLAMVSAGVDFTMTSDFIASSYAIEHTRRKRIEKEKDWRLDENIVIIALKNDKPEKAIESGIFYVPQLLNHYNTRILPSENFRRNIYLFSSVQNWESQYWLQSHEGKVRYLYDDSVSLSGFIFSPISIQANCVISWEDYKVIRDNRHKKIRLIIGDEERVVFINKAEYSIFDSRLQLVGWETQTVDEFLLLEDGTFMLLENEDKILLER